MYDFFQRKNEGDDWNLSFRRQLFAWEEDDLIYLNEYLQAAPSLRHHVEDQCSWLAHPSGVFSVVSLWHWLALSKGSNLKFVMDV